MTQESIQILLAVIAMLAVAGIAILFMRKRRTEHLKSRFGDEYDRLAQRTGDDAKAEALLAAREKRVSALTVKPVSAQDRERYVTAWRDVQGQFVDDPKGAVSKADDLLGEVMQTCGYPVSDFAQRAADLSVEHADVVHHYRTAHDIAVRHERGEAGTEDLRQAMIHYRALFDDLVNEPPDTPPVTSASDARPAPAIAKEKVRD